MPDSITVAAFVVGLVLVIAALLGKELKVAAVELPALSSRQRVILGAMGVALVVFGLTDGHWFGSAGGPGTVSTPTPMAAPTPATGSTAADCFPDVPESDRVVAPIVSGRRTDLGFGSGQPRIAAMVIQFSQDGVIIGGLEFKTEASGSGFEILRVVDGVCKPITTYENASRPGQPKDAPYSYDTMAFQFGDIVIAMDVSYAEGGGQLYLRAQQTAP
jgi:hypothetical protein